MVPKPKSQLLKPHIYTSPSHYPIIIFCVPSTSLQAEISIESSQASGRCVIVAGNHDAWVQPITTRC